MKVLLNSILAIFCFVCTSNIKAQIPDKAEDISPLLIGEKLPKANLQNAAGDLIDLSTVLKEKPTVLVFYRGGWCPYCNAQLSGLVDIEAEVISLGYQIVAISPDDYQNLKPTESKGNIKYTLFSDPNAKFIQQVGIGFKTPTMLKGFIATKKHMGKTSKVMPVPTVMIISKKEVIQFEYINPNYKERINGELLLAILKTIKI
ncbi:peroxiredoxin-like family protein [Aequorivita marina]|uniref:peroxiredoxin-like family protein n=1 Tax=Aequorivita marina TaxID=3073654 RepID=UPI00287505A7|nr:peroxiredoxin-like family protein [Aequorivita sp. S2608]MDS1298415.1 peroxiredoxin-like family protein [Aequorivita sp. S2608]